MRLCEILINSRKKKELARQSARCLLQQTGGQLRDKVAHQQVDTH
jgi:hypothetical protein